MFDEPSEGDDVGEMAERADEKNAAAADFRRHMEALQIDAVGNDAHIRGVVRGVAASLSDMTTTRG